MPVVRNRGGFRFDSGKGYPSIKWHDVKRATVIANEHQFKTEDETTKPLKQQSNCVCTTPSSIVTHVPPRNKTRLLGKELWPWRSGRFCTEGESAGEDNSTESSLIYSDFRLGPERGQVRMALTVPISRLSGFDGGTYSSFRSTEQVRPVIDRPVPDKRSIRGTGAPSLCQCKSYPHSKALPCSQKLVAKGGLVPSQLAKQQLWVSKDKGRPCAMWASPGHRIDLRAGCGLVRDTKVWSIPPNTLQSSPHWASTCLATTSRRCDMKTEKQGYFVPHKGRFRDATFIIHVSDGEKRGFSELHKSTPCTKASCLKSLTDATSPHLSWSWLAPSNKAHGGCPLPVGLVLSDPLPVSNTSLGVSLSLSRPPITLTSASHTTLRCYPSLGCHPAPKYHSCARISPSESLALRGVTNTPCKNGGIGGLTIRNPHATMDSDQEELDACSRPLGRAKSTLSRPSVFPTNPLGQRNSSGGGTLTPCKLPGNLSVPSQGSSQVRTPKHPVSLPPQRNTATSKGKKVLKTYHRETGSKKSLQTRTKSASNSSVTNSSISLHGRVLQKTASVSPAPAKPLSAIQSNSLTRFGFKRNSLIGSGDSTDSVNSILSDAQTASDANSNIFDFLEENGNPCSKSPVLHSSELSPRILPDNQSEAKDSSYVRGASPCTISQASSGVTSTLLDGKLKAQTRQLPMPQIVTVKSMYNPKKASSGHPNGSPRLRYATPVSRKEASPQRSPLVAPKDQRLKIPQNVTKSSPPKVQRMSRDSESSSKSSNTADSGLGSSSESDKLRSSATSPPKSENSQLPVPSLLLKNSEEVKLLELDLSDAWLKQKRDNLDSKNEPCSLDLKFRENLTFSNRANQSIGDKPLQKESFKDKRDSSITYGMARQKFAPYTRNRIGHQNSPCVTKGSPTSGVGSKKEVSLSKTKLGEGSIVRRRIAQLEKTPAAPANSSTPFKPPRKPVARPTAIEKTPILVSPKTENTVELSRSICRRLEYSEGKSALLEVIKDIKFENHLIELPTTAQDLLMVDSFEVKKKKYFGSIEKHPLASTDDIISVKLPDKASPLEADGENGEHKRIKDISECENTTKRFSEDSNGNPASATESKDSLPGPISVLPDVSTKIPSPDESDTSFEILESSSVDLSPTNGELDKERDGDSFLSRVVAGFVTSPLSPLVRAKHTQSSPSRVTPLKKCRQDLNDEDTTLKLRLETPLNRDLPLNKGSPVDSQTPRSDCPSEGSFRSRYIMESSADSGRSGESIRTSEFGDRWTVSGKCTPTLSSTRGDVDQDFLIDDEIADQPGLTFGDELESSLFGDEDLFSDISSPTASHLLSKTERSRQGSLGTTSSLGPEDLMLDYDLDEIKHTGQPQVSSPAEAPKIAATRKEGPIKVKSFDIALPGPRYEEEVLSPVACDILTEWSAILSESHSPSRHSVGQACVSHPTVGLADSATSSISGELNPSSPSDVIDINTRQPQSINKEGVDEYAPLPRGLPSRTRAIPVSAAQDCCLGEAKKGLNFKPPRQGASEREGGISIDRTTLHYICQDVTSMKTLLLRLRRVLQVTDTINPFDSNLKTSLYMTLGANEGCCEQEGYQEQQPHNTSPDVVQQNVDLKRQVVLLQQRLDEKDRTIRILQQQVVDPSLSLTKSLNRPGNSTSPHFSSTPPPGSVVERETSSLPVKVSSNAATQTERLCPRSSPFNLAAISRTSSIEDGLGPTVSSEMTVRDAFNDFNTSNSSHIVDVSSEERKKQTVLCEKFTDELITPSSIKPPTSMPAISSVASVMGGPLFS